LKTKKEDGKVKSDFEKKVTQNIVEGINNCLIKGFKIPQLIEFLETCPDIPENVWKDRSIIEKTLIYINYVLKIDYSLEDTKDLPRLTKLLKIPQEAVKRVVLSCLVADYGLPRHFKEIVEIFDLQQKDFDIKKLEKSIHNYFNLSPLVYEEQWTENLLFCAEFFPLSEEVRKKIYAGVMASYILDVADESYLERADMILGIKTSDRGKIALLAVENTIEENFCFYSRSVDNSILLSPAVSSVNKMIEVLKRYNTDVVLVTEEDIRLLAKGALDLLDENDFVGARKIIDLFSLESDDFDRERVLKVVEYHLSGEKDEIADFLIFYADISSEEIQKIACQKLGRLVRDKRKALDFAQAYHISLDTVKTIVEEIVVEDLSHPNARPEDICRVIDNFPLSEEFLKSSRVLELAKAALLTAYHKCDAKSVVLLKQKFGI